MSNEHLTAGTVRAVASLHARWFVVCREATNEAFFTPRFVSHVLRSNCSSLPVELDHPSAHRRSTAFIGYFPLLPGSTNVWLKEFLQSRFPKTSEVNYFIPESDRYLAEDSARIATMGTYLGRYKDLTLAASLGSRRDKKYVERFRKGTAGWYHMPLTTTDNKAIERNVIREIRYCAIGVHHTGSPDRVITHLYEVKSVRMMKRCHLSAEQTGIIDSSNEDSYWLFELGYSISLLQPVTMPVRTFKFQLTSAAELCTAKSCDALPRRYALLR